MKILITGNMGYVGPALVRFLRQNRPDAFLLGFDSGFFGQSLTGCAVLPETLLDRQVFGDVRDLPDELLEGVDAVVSLAAISNDPMGKTFETATGDINLMANVALAKKCRAAGVRAFVFASSCSLYGASAGGARKETDPANPLTAYARSKIGTEDALRAMDLGEMVVTSLRFATACGMSDRLRLDLVLNDFVACALASREITVLSDGTPWRPLIDVNDMARAIDWAIGRGPIGSERFLAVNVGRDEANYQVKDLAEAVAAAVPGTKVSINTSAPPDLRSYKVDFSLLRSLAPSAVPQISLHDSIVGLRDGLSAMGFADADFRSSPFMRLKTLESHIAQRRLDADLRWLRDGSAARTA